MSHPCPSCNRIFRSASALRSHTEAVHLLQYPCDRCSRSFRSATALQSHKNGKHRLEPDIFEGTPFPGAEGYWVYRSDSRVQKGFGMFECNQCYRYWSSAHAYKTKYTQNCQGCRKSFQPYIMWHFTAQSKKEEHQVNEGPPHDAANCSACQSGIFCTTARPVSTRSHSSLAPYSSTSGATTAPRAAPTPSTTSHSSLRPDSTTSGSTTASRSAPTPSTTSHSSLRPDSTTSGSTTASTAPITSSTDSSRYCGCIVC